LLGESINKEQRNREGVLSVWLVISMGWIGKASLKMQHYDRGLKEE
jgi:hypothetical protein